VKSLIVLIGIALVLLVAMGFYVVHGLTRYAHTPFRASAGFVVLSVPAGQGFGSTTEELIRAGVIHKPHWFRWFARLYGYDRAIKAGEYRLSAAMTPAEVLQELVSGKVLLHRLTVPEGSTCHQIAALVAAVGFSNAARFEKLTRDPGFVHQLGLPGESFEGYLFPDTYFFPKGATARDIIETMVRRFQSVMTPQWRARAAALKMSIEQVTTLASMIEKETGVPSERALVSSVFHNRLKRGMRLASDPTVIYGLPHFDGNLTRAQLETHTPYNTYLIKGLPPGPIANPGRAAIEAALYPKKTDYLFFVAKGDGTHQFSTNVTAHNLAVRKYQLHR
jgi:peptidoglycan lytic transglycosylase G